MLVNLLFHASASFSILSQGNIPMQQAKNVNKVPNDEVLNLATPSITGHMLHHQHVPVNIYHILSQIVNMASYKQRIQFVATQQFLSTYGWETVGLE